MSAVTEGVRHGGPRRVDFSGRPEYVELSGRTRSVAAVGLAVTQPRCPRDTPSGAGGQRQQSLPVSCGAPWNGASASEGRRPMKPRTPRTRALTR